MLFGGFGTIGAGLPHMQAITGMVVVELGGVRYLVTAAQTDGGMTSFRLSPGAAAQQVDTRVYSPATGTLGASDLALVSLGGVPVIVAGGRQDDAFALHGLGADGAFGALEGPPAGTAVVGQTSDLAVVETGAGAWLFSARAGQPGLYAHALGADLGVSYLRYTADTAQSFIQNVTALATARVAGNDYLIATGGFDNGITAFRVGAGGVLTVTGSAVPGPDLPIHRPSALAVAEVGGETFLIVGAAGSGTLSTLRVDAAGALDVRDTRADTMQTYFRNVSALEAVTVEGRGFVIAGGNDGGVSLFELVPGGGLFHMASLPHKTGLSLLDVSAIAAEVLAGEVQIFISSATQPGLTQLTLGTSTLAPPIIGDDTGATLAGDARDDLIIGGAGDDLLIGGGGNNRLIDGPGADTMTGGAGRTIFTLVPDDDLDIITDFTPGTDLIDLSRYPNLHWFGQLTLAPEGAGVLVTVQGDELLVFGASGSLAPADLGPADFLF